MLGERYINADKYLDGTDPRDDQNIFVAHDRDMNGYTALHLFESGTATTRVVYRDPPVNNGALRQDRPGLERIYDFGSAHPAGIHMAFCDGSVQSVDYAINPKVFWAMGGRDDEENVTEQ
jgi:prepilin-type processing-associated H-X9-DG protein